MTRSLRSAGPARPARSAIRSAAVALGLSAALSACAGGPPSNAEKADFCTAYGEASTALQAAMLAPPNEAEWAAIQTEFADLAEIGTPEDTPDQARRGFEVVVDTVADLSHEEAADALAGQDPLPGIKPKQDEQVDEFAEWAGEECATPASDGSPAS
jgi:hypothetical protein